MSALSQASSSSPSPRIIHEHQNVASSSKLISSSDKALSIEALCLHIFTFLSLSSFMNTCRVNRAWREWTNNNGQIWQAKLPPDIRDDFASLVDQKLVTWKDVYLYARLSPFVASIIESRYSWPDFIHDKNPTLAIPHPFNNLNQIMPKPFVKYGNFQFAICNLTEIEVSEEGNLNSFFLKDEAGIMFTHLAVEGDFIFALRQDGVIVYWNYKSREKKSGEIQTAYSTSEKFNSEKYSKSTTFCNGFYIRNETIIIRHEWNLKNPIRSIRSEKLLEIIPVKDPTKSQLIEHFPLVTNFICIEVLENNRMITVGKDWPYQQRSMYITQLTHHEKNTVPNHYLGCTDLAYRSLKNITANKASPIIDPKAKATNLVKQPENVPMDACIVIENLVFSFFFWHGQLNIDVMKIDAENNAWQVAHGVKDLIPLHSITPEWRLKLLRKLLVIAKKELGRGIPLVAGTPDLIVATIFDPESPFQPKPKSKPKNGCVIA